MIIDIREEVPDLLKYVRRRVDEHVAKAAKVKNLQPVTLATFGFEFGQSNWVALVFDTRPDAEPDGEWTLLDLDEVLIKRPKWPIWHELPEDEIVYFINLAGQKINIMEDPDDITCNIIGEAMKHVMLTARDEGVFDKLPKADHCEIGVENLEGYYDWPEYDERGHDNLV